MTVGIPPTLCAVMVAASLVLQSGAHNTAGVESRVNDLLARMTIEEKFGQLQQLDGHADGRFRPEHLDLVR